MARQTIKRKIALAALRSDDAAGNPTVHSIKYRKKDGQIGYKNRVIKSFRHLPGASKFRGNLSENHELLLINKEEQEPSKQHFRIKIDLLIAMDGLVIDHTNGEHNGNPNFQ